MMFVSRMPSRIFGCFLFFKRDIRTHGNLTFCGVKTTATDRHRIDLRKIDANAKKVVQVDCWYSGHGCLYFIRAIFVLAVIQSPKIF